ncbi:MAG TPA: transcription antitermination factor NusB [Ruminococcaceae bacterium]|nr:transcription antitermination factor NusB [Oscillospiraceae bacterium]
MVVKMGSPSANKRKSREQAFIILFEKSFNTELSVDEIMDIAVETEVISKDKMTADIVRKAEEHIEEIDAVIERNLKGWSKQRISKVSLALLRMAVCEMKYFEKVPVGVSINEAVEICKVYGSDEDKSFVNGILGSISRATSNN